MSTPLVLLCVWAVAANVLAMLPSRRRHWPQAVALIVTGIPLLGWITYAHGPLIGLLAFAAGASVLRWPLLFLGRWVARRFRPGHPAE